MQNFSTFLEINLQFFCKGKLAGTSRKVFFRKNEYCFFFTLTQRKDPCRFANFSSLFYLKDPSEDSFLEEFINKTVEKLMLTNSGKKFEFRLGLDYGIPQLN